MNATDSEGIEARKRKRRDCQWGSRNSISLMMSVVAIWPHLAARYKCSKIFSIPVRCLHDGWWAFCSIPLLLLDLSVLFHYSPSLSLSLSLSLESPPCKSGGLCVCVFACPCLCVSSPRVFLYRSINSLECGLAIFRTVFTYFMTCAQRFFFV